MNTKKILKKMAAILGLIVLILIAALYIYTYRWNITSPNKSASVRVGTMERTFIYHVPGNLKKNPKLVILYHGSNMKAFMMQIFTGHEFDLLADQDQDAIVVYPQGFKNNWNDCRKNAPFPAKELNIDDIGFTEKLIAYFKEKYQIDTDNVFAAGFSNGGQMVMKLANTRASLFKGFAVISANRPTDDNNECTALQQPVSMIYFSGKKDPIVPFEGGSTILDGKDFGKVVPSEQNSTYWIQAAQCDASAVSSKVFVNTSRAVTARQADYSSAVTQKRVSYVEIEDGGHTIPNANFRIPISKMGNMNKEVDAPQIIWDFFKGLK
jgi:polyhydroxybutyrate depolymerase